MHINLVCSKLRLCIPETSFLRLHNDGFLVRGGKRLKVSISISNCTKKTTILLLLVSPQPGLPVDARSSMAPLIWLTRKSLSLFSSLLASSRYFILVLKVLIFVLFHCPCGWPCTCVLVNKCDFNIDSAFA